MRRKFSAIFRRFSWLSLAAFLAAAYGQSIKTGPAVGERVPDFSAQDQASHEQTLKSIMGRKGVMLVFFRSADWWPFCKTQLVELERNLDAIRKQGLGLAAVSYDSVAVLKSFADRQHITYPLLSDPESKVIRAFGILNETVTPGTATYGIPHPGTYILDPQGKVVSKHFEDDYRERTSSTDILVRVFGKSPDGAGGVAETKQLRLTTAASTQVARPGHRIVLSLKIELKPGMHVYAPGVQGYIPIDWKLEDGVAAKPHAFSYPASRMMHLKAIGETVPVYRGLVPMTREITFGPEGALKPLVGSTSELIVKGSFRYQACDDRKCYVPETIPLEWRFQFQALDRERVPADLQRKRP